MEKRIIGRYEGKEKGPLLICIGGMHGNEPTGVQAIEEVLKLLSSESNIKPGFVYRGRMIGLKGNLAALKVKQRFIDRDLNRMLMPVEVERIRKLNPEKLRGEDKECLELLETIETERKNYQPTLTLILDLHTTTADGGIFTIAPEGDFNKMVAKGLHVPVVLGIAERLTGTTIEYFQQPSLNCYCIGFEAGQHDDPEGIHRSVAAIVNCMRSIGSVDPGDVDHKHDGLLMRLSIGLPKVTRLIYHYTIRPEEHFLMNPGYKNFQQVTEGEELAGNENGPVLAISDGLILMPKYQSQGEDGFYIVEVVEP